MVILVITAKSVAIFYQVTATGSCLKCSILGYCVTNKQELKTKHNNKLAISQKFVISLLFEGAATELQMDCYLQFLSVPWGLGIMASVSCSVTTMQYLKFALKRARA